MKNLGLMITGIFILVFVLSESGCNAPSVNGIEYTIPVQQNDGLQTGNAKEAGLTIRMLEDVTKAIGKGKFNEIHSMLIYKNNMLVFEQYFAGHQYQWDAPAYHGEWVEWNVDTRHPIMSCTKSITSACIAIAIEKGFIKSVHQSIFEYLPDHQRLKTNKRNYITIEHLLTMTSGLAWDEWSTAHGSDLTNDIDALWFAEDQVEAVLERPWWAAPGEFFTYNGGGMVILGEIIKNATGMNIEEFANTYLFAPLGIAPTQWLHYENGKIESAGSLSLTPRSMLKFGVCYLNGGTWNGQKVIPSVWVNKSAEPYRNNVDIKLPIEDSGLNGYAYTWWTSEMTCQGKTIKMYRANGWGGQVIMVFPELEMVVVFTGGNWAKKSKLFKLVNKYVLPAINNLK